MSYLLDTNACISIINGQPRSVRARLETALDTQIQVWTSSIVSFELWYGVQKSARLAENTQRLRVFLAGPIGVLPFDDEDARAAGTLRASLEGSGRPIGAYDVMIAGQALRRDLTLVTMNVSEFRRIRGLAWEDWARPR